MTSSNLTPKPGAFVRAHLDALFDQLREDEEELLRLQSPSYAKDTFRLSTHPFLKQVDAIEADGSTNQFWVMPHVIRGQRFRVCSQWTEKRLHREFFATYLVERGIPVQGVSADQLEAWMVTAEEAGTKGTSPGGARYRSHAIGNAQNAFVRYLLSNVGFEEFTEAEWVAVKAEYGDRCAYCGAIGTLQMDHAIPLSRLQLGEHRLGNLVPACPPCNSKKSNLRFRSFLETVQSTEENAARVAVIEQHMASHGYRPLGDREDIQEVIEEARQEIVALAGRYLARINELV